MQRPPRQPQPQVRHDARRTFGNIVEAISDSRGGMRFFTRPRRSPRRLLTLQTHTGARHSTATSTAYIDETRY